VDEIELRSDNAAGAAPEIVDAVIAANAGSALAYGGDELTERLQRVVREVFEHDDAQVYPVTSGTAANALGLSSLSPPWGAVLCHETAHILNSEGGATSMLGAGAVMRGIGGDDFRMSPDALRAALAATRWGDPHHSQPAVLSFTQPTDMGTVYPVDAIAELAAIARDAGMRVHLDGARIANAVAAIGCTPAEMTWRAGVDVLTLGATKNGGLSAEAIVSFDPAASEELVYRTKRAGHVTSKMRFQSAQLIAYLSEGRWLALAAAANARMRRLADGLATLGLTTRNRADVNMLFVEVTDEQADELAAAGVRFYRTQPGLIRLVTSWQTTEREVELVLEHVRSVVTAR
jgi:threonine aldolase